MISVILLFLFLFVAYYIIVLIHAYRLHLKMYYQMKSSRVPIVMQQFVPIFPLPYSVASWINYFGLYTQETMNDLMHSAHEDFDSPIVQYLNYGKIFTSVRSVALIKEVLVKKKAHLIKPTEYYKIFDYYGPNILSSNGKEWEVMRKMLNPVFTVEKHLEMIVHASFEHTNTFIKLYHGAIEPAKVMSRLTLDVIGSTLFGYDVGALTEHTEKYAKHDNPDVPKDAQFTMRYIFENLLISSIGNYFLGNWGKYIPLDIFQNMNGTLENFDLYLEHIIEKRKTEGGKFDLMSILVGSDLDKEVVKANMFLLFFAGFDTTSRGLTWILLLLANHQDIQNKLYKQVVSVLGDRDPTMDDVKNLSYATNCFKEALRLFGPVQQIIKKAVDTFDLGGYQIEKDSMIMANVYSLHHDERIWPKPNEFIPERFEEDVPPGTWLPFSEGARDCLGKQVALIEATIAISMIIRKFEVKMIDPTIKNVFETKTMLLVEPKHSHQVFLKFRE
jgi:cytochrome P450